MVLCIICTIFVGKVDRVQSFRVQRHFLILLDVHLDFSYFMTSESPRTYLTIRHMHLSKSDGFIQALNGDPATQTPMCRGSYLALPFLGQGPCGRIRVK